MQFIVKIINSDNIKDELIQIGFDNSYIDIAKNKHEFLNIKIQGLKPHQATIIKQTALSKGCDGAVHRDVLMNSIDLSDLILSGSKKQIIDVANSLKNQPFSLNIIAEQILNLINLKKGTPQIAGILNVTDNSFSDGTLDKKEIILKAKSLIEDGADILDIGAEATNPNAKPITPEIEIERLNGIIPEIKKMGKVKISVDTRNSKTAKFAIDEGADIINDVSGLNYDPEMKDVIKNSNAEIVIMHSKGTPQTMDELCNYDNLIDEIYKDLSQKIELLDIKKERIIIDVGFGFAKNHKQNYLLLNKIKEFNSLGYRQMAGVSRKRFLGGDDDMTMLASFYLIENGVDIIRVHNVKKTKLALDFFNSIHPQKFC